MMNQVQGWRRWQRKRANQELKLSPPSTSPRKVLKAQEARTSKIPRAPPLVALRDYHHHPCVLAQGISYVSDDSSNDESDVETDETSEMITLLHNQQEHLIKQNKEIKTLKAKEKLHASFVSRYENLLNKYNLLDNEHEELKMKYESLESKSESSSDKSFPCNIPCATPIIKVDASTSCDLTPRNEDVIVETCDDLIAKEK